MKNHSTFDMVGPSVSHTAEAAKLSNIAKEIAGVGFYEVEFILHGSFAKTYREHGTDKALVAGILGIETSDYNMKNSFELIKKRNINIIFSEKDLEYGYPNTAKIVFRFRNKEDFYIIGSSIGNGNIIITDLNGNKVELTGDNPAIILKYKDRKGVVSELSSILANDNLNIATMKVSREKDIASLVCELDSPVNEDIVAKVSSMKGMSYVKFIYPISN